MDVFEKHILDLSSRAYERGYSTYSEFLNLDEISTLYSLEMPTSFKLFGGYENAERCVACFIGETNSDNYPISCIHISPLNKRFADKLNHRDYLGALMNLGINRNTLGDILFSQDEAYLFCLDTMSEYIIENLTRIKHTVVKCEKVNQPELIKANEPETVELTVSSSRVDAVCSGVYRLSRSGASELFKSGKIFINSRLCEKEGTPLKDGDRVSVRGKGKFIFNGTLRETKRGRYVISVSVYK